MDSYRRKSLTLVAGVGLLYLLLAATSVLAATQDFSGIAYHWVETDFLFKVNTGTAVDIEACRDGGLTGSGTTVTILDPAGVEVEEELMGVGTACITLNFTAASSGTYKIRFVQGAWAELSVWGTITALPGFMEEVGDPVEEDHDPDGDGINSDRDNCPHDSNPDQEDGWGSGMGDLCDTDWYNMTGIGIAGFEQKDGTYHLHGNCTFMPDGDPRCPEAARFDPRTFEPGDMPLEVTTEFAGAWSVWIHYLYSADGVAVYQVNIYSSNPPQPDTLLDDRLEIHVREDGSWTWHMRGGLEQYNGI